MLITFIYGYALLFKRNVKCILFITLIFPPHINHSNVPHNRESGSCRDTHWNIVSTVLTIIIIIVVVIVVIVIITIVINIINTVFTTVISTIIIIFITTIITAIIIILLLLSLLFRLHDRTINTTHHSKIRHEKSIVKQYIITSSKSPS